MKWGLWSQTAASNSATPPDGWPEGQAPSTVNDCAREMMASIATGLQDLQFIDLGLTPTQTSGTTFTVSGNYANVLHYGRRIKVFDGAATLYGTINQVASFSANTNVSLRFDAGNAPLDSSLSSFAVGFPSQQNGAAPENVFRNKNYIQNSQFDIWQRGGGPFSFSAANATVKCTADRWTVFLGVASAGPTISVTRNERSAGASNVPTLAQCGVLLNNCLAVSINTAVSGLAGGDYLSLQQSMEGFNWRQLAQKPMMLSFWVNSTITGTYCVSMGGGGNNCVLEYSISSVATWEKKTIALPPSLSTGTWDYSTGAGIVCRWILGCGTTYQGTGNVWAATAILATSNQAQMFQNTSSTFKLAAVKLEEGNQATPLAPVDYAQELALCERYLQFIPGSSQGATVPQLFGGSTTTQNGVFPVNLNVPMRLAPALSYPAVNTIGVGNASNVQTSCSTVGTFISTPFRVAILATTTGAPFSANNVCFLNMVGTGIIIKSEP